MGFEYEFEYDDEYEYQVCPLLSALYFGRIFELLLQMLRVVFLRGLGGIGV